MAITCVDNRHSPRSGGLFRVPTAARSGGWRIIEVSGPTIHTHTLVADDELRVATASLIDRPPEVVVVTTAIGLRSWLSAAGSWDLDDRLVAVLGRSKIITRGPKALGAVRALGLESEWQEESERLSNLLTRLCPSLGAGSRVAFLDDGGDGARSVERIRATGAEVVEVRSYRWTLPADSRPALRLIRAVCEHRVDALTFTSPPAVRNLFELAEGAGMTAALLQATNAGAQVVCCVGPATAGAARQAGIIGPIHPEKGRLGLLTRAVAKALAGHRRELMVAGARVVIQGSTVRIDDTAVNLADRERSLLEQLLDNAGAVVSSDRLLRAVWGDAGNDHILDVTLGRLRRRLGPAGAALHRVPRRGLWIEATTLAG